MGCFAGLDAMSFGGKSLAVALLLSACGGGEGTPAEESGGAGGMAGTGGSAGTVSCPMPLPVSGGSIAPLETDGARLDGDTNGGWFFFHPNEADGCGTCMTTPAPGDPPEVVLEPLEPPRGDSSKALHYSGSGFVPMTYGAGAGIYLDNCANVDAGVTGITFSYRSDSSVTFGSAQAGVDHVVVLAASDEWTVASVAFEDLAPNGLDQTQLQNLHWRVPGPTAGTFSLWLDDVRWIGGTAP